MLPSCVLKHEGIHCVSVQVPGKSLKAQLQFIVTVTLLVSVALIFWLCFLKVFLEEKGD